LGTKNVAIGTITVLPNRMRQLRPEKIDELAQSIAAIGLLQPVVLRPNDVGYELVAGLHRLKAVTKLGQKHITAVILDSLDSDHARLAEIDENLVHADLSPAERALHLNERKRLYEKLHPEAVSVRVRGGPGRGKKNESQNGTRFSPSFIDDTTAKTGKGRSTVAREIARAAKISNLRDVIGTALDKPDELDALAKLPADTQRDLIARAKAGERVDVKVAVSRAHRARRVQELAESTLAASEALGQKLYGVLYIDPPWQYAEELMGDVARAVEEHYPTMSLDEIRALSVPAANDCCLFLWTTVPMLADALTVMNAWGFTYKTTITWVKDKLGIGYWVRSQCEHLLVGVRGNVPTPARGDQLPAVIGTPRLGHSEKPDVFAEHIERVFPNVPKLEMFARKGRPGWDVWGNEAPQEAVERRVRVVMPNVGSDLNDALIAQRTAT
jgi:N6-adenosine-specific RNA methylase IME4